MKQKNTEKILAQTRDIYNAIAPDFSDTRGKWWQPPFEFGQTVRDGIKVLDLGCGNGRFAELFRGRDIEYLGVDNSEELINLCQERFVGEKNIKFEVGDILSLNLSESKFDLVLVIAVLHHLPSRDLRLQALKNIYQVMAPSGKLIMRNWNLFNCKTAKQYYRRLFDFTYKVSRGVWNYKDAFIPWKSLGRDVWRYVHSFTKREMCKLLREARFEEINCYYESYSSDQPVSVFKGYNLVSTAIKSQKEKADA